MALIDFTLSNARRFYSSMGNPLGWNGLICLSLHLDGGLRLGCGYFSPQEWFHPAGVGLTANRKIVLGT